MAIPTGAVSKPPKDYRNNPPRVATCILGVSYITNSNGPSEFMSLLTKSTDLTQPERKIATITNTNL